MKGIIKIRELLGFAGVQKKERRVQTINLKS